MSMLRVLGLNNPEWKYNLVGSLSAIVVGAALPMFAIIFGEFFGVIYSTHLLMSNYFNDVSVDVNARRNGSAQ